MRKVIICDSDRKFLQDVQTKLMLEDYPFRAETVADLPSVYETMGKVSEALVVLAGNVVSRDDFDKKRLSGREVYCYAANGTDIDAIKASGLPFMGVMKSSDKLLEAIGMPQISANILAEEKPKQQTKALEPVASIPEEPKEAEKDLPEKKPEAPMAPIQEAVAPSFQIPVNMSNEQMMALLQQMMAQFQTPNAAPAKPYPSASNPETGITDLAEEVAESFEEESGASKISKKMKRRLEEEAERRLAEEMLNAEKPSDKKTVVVSVYAAKGGVGKTTIATETAVCLALTSNGRRKFKVCIVDYNIDFGDVASTLKLDEAGNNMVGWAAEIDERIANGSDPAGISFTKKEMEENYLQKMDDVGLYCLVAPIAHEDSMAISSEALEIMLRNIIQNGGYDYVVCDTGNNTRDGSIVALDASEYVLMVATQDVTTANCNAAVLRTIQKTGFDTDKVRLVVNNVISTRECGISVQEVEETFDYPCVCRIKRTPDIIKANNLGRPLVFKPNHEYTKQIQKIVAFITSGEILEEEPVKRRCFFRR